MNNLSIWLRAARLRTLPLALSCVVIGAFMAAYYQHFNGSILALSALTTILLQVLANFSNDYGDAVNGADNESRIGPDRMVQSGRITVKQMRTGIIVTAIFTLISGVRLLFVSFGNAFLEPRVLILLLLGLLSIAAAVHYTAGKNPYGYRGLGDLSVFLFFGLLGVLGSVFLYTHQFNWHYLWPAITIGTLSVAVLNLNNMRDRPEDEKAGKITLPVRLGQHRAKVYHLFLLAAALLAALSFSWHTGRPHFQFVYLLPFLLLGKHAVKVWKTEHPADFDPELKKVALSTFAFALLFGIGLIL